MDNMEHAAHLDRDVPEATRAPLIDLSDPEGFSKRVGEIRTPLMALIAPYIQPPDNIMELPPDERGKQMLHRLSATVTALLHIAGEVIGGNFPPEAVPIVLRSVLPSIEHGLVSGASTRADMDAQSAIGSIMAKARASTKQ